MNDYTVVAIMFMHVVLHSSAISFIYLYSTPPILRGFSEEKIRRVKPRSWGGPRRIETLSSSLYNVHKTCVIHQNLCNINTPRIVRACTSACST